MKEKSFAIGDTVKYSRNFLRSTGTYTGNIPFARGTITALESFGDSVLATIDWHNPEIPKQVITFNLVKVGQVENV